MEDDDNQRWHISKGIPVAFIMTMLVFSITQAATAAWFFARQDSRLESLEKTQAVTANQGERLTRVEEKLENVKAGIVEIKTLLTQNSREIRTR